MKIAYLCSRLSQTGPMNQLYSIIKHMDSTHFDISIITLSKTESNSRVEKFKQLGCSVLTLNLDRIPNPITVRKKFRSVIERINPDIVHSHGFRSDLLLSYVSIAATTVSTIHCYQYKHYPVKYGRFFGRAMAWSHIRSLDRIEYPVACSRYVSNQIQNHSVQTTVIQNGVESTRYKPVSDSKQTSIRHDIGIEKNKNIFVSVGTLNNRKDPMTVINGFLKAEIENSKLVVLSGGPLLDRCQRKVSDNPEIEVLGRVPSVEKYLQAADGFISASWYEGLPLAVLEALSSGLPVCLSDIDPHREIIEYDQRAGTLFPCGNPDALAKAMETLLDGNQNTRSSAARKIVESKLNSKRMSNEYQNLYQNVIPKIRSS